MQGKMKHSDEDVNKKGKLTHLPNRSLQHRLQKNLSFLKLQELVLHLQIPWPINKIDSHTNFFLQYLNNPILIATFVTPHYQGHIFNIAQNVPAVTTIKSLT